MGTTTHVSVPVFSANDTGRRHACQRTPFGRLRWWRSSSARVAFSKRSGPPSMPVGRDIRVNPEAPSANEGGLYRFSSEPASVDAACANSSVTPARNRLAVGAESFQTRRLNTCGFSKRSTEALPALPSICTLHMYSVLRSERGRRQADGIAPDTAQLLERGGEGPLNACHVARSSGGTATAAGGYGRGRTVEARRTTKSSARRRCNRPWPRTLARRPCWFLTPAFLYTTRSLRHAFRAAPNDRSTTKRLGAAYQSVRNRNAHRERQASCSGRDRIFPGRSRPRPRRGGAAHKPAHCGACSIAGVPGRRSC